MKHFSPPSAALYELQKLTRAMAQLPQAEKKITAKAYFAAALRVLRREEK